MDQTFVDKINKREKEILSKPSLAKKSIISTTQITKQELIIIGYIRKENENLLYLNDFILLLKYYSKWYSNPLLDPANFISNDEITKSNIYRLKGNNLFKHKQYQDAIIKYNTAFMFNPNDDKILCNRSLCYLLLNDKISANMDAYASILRRPTNPKCWYRFAVVAESLNDITTAYIAYETSAKILKLMNNQNQDINNCFNILKKKLNHRHKLWIKHFNKREISQSFILKLPKYLKMTGLTEKKLTSNQYLKHYISLFGLLFSLRQESNVIKYTLGHVPITSIKTHPSWSWCVSYFTFGADIIEGNKRTYRISILCRPPMFSEGGDVIFGKPTAKTIIYAILKAIVHPYTHPYPYKPVNIILAHRLKDEAKEIRNTLINFGIGCLLQSKESHIMECNKYNSNVYGFNYIQNREQLIANAEYCGNRKCKMTKKKLRRKYHGQFKLCSACKGKSYCSRKCQKYDWKYHHRELCYF